MSLYNSLIFNTYQLSYTLHVLFLYRSKYKFKIREQPKSYI